MNQPILLYRSGSVYANETAAWAALDAVTHKKGQPIVAFYTLSSPVSGHHGSSTIGAIFAIGIGDGVGQYKACTSHDDMLIVAQSLNAHITQFNQMFEYDANHNAIKAKLDFYTTDGKSISAGGIGSGSSASLGALYQLVDVMANSSNTGVEGAVEGSVLAYDATAGKWKAIAQSEILPDMSDYYTKDETDSAINTAKSNLQGQVDTLHTLIPATATADNQLADKDFVNSSIATATAEFRGSFTSLDELKATSGNLNDYAFYLHKDSVGNSIVDRYKWTTAGWLYEYTLNNSSFTAEQWAALNSAITATLVQSYNSHLNNSTIHITSTERNAWNNKWDYNEETIKAVKVNAAASADYASSASNADTLDGYHADIMVKSHIDSTDNFTRFTDRAFFQTAWVSGQGDFCSLVIPTWRGNNTDTYYTTELRFEISSVNPKIRFTKPSGTSDWYTLARTVDNVASATKLQTPRTIWGQSFDGTKDIDGDATFTFYDGQKIIIEKNAGGSNYCGISFYNSGFKVGTITASTLLLNPVSGGNVLIGTATDNGYKLDVNGKGHYSGDLICGGEVVAIAGEGTPAGVTDYSALTGKPLINGVTLVSGNNTLASLGIQAAGDYATNSGVTTLLADYAKKTFVANNYAGKAAFNSHIADTYIHITEAERTAWNAKWDYNEATIKAVKVTSASSADSVAWSGISGKPSTFTPSAHTHTASDVSGLPTSLKNPCALTFGSKSYDGSAAATITASDLGALTAHQTIYALTLQVNSVSQGTYNPASAAKTINISVPTKTSDITNDSGFITSSAIPTALKNPFAVEIKANGVSLGTYDGSAAATFNLSAANVGAANKVHSHAASEISGLPTNLSAFTNDVGYLTSITKSMVEGVLTGNITSHTHSYLPLSGGTLNHNNGIGFRAYSAYDGGGGWAVDVINLYDRDVTKTFGRLGYFGNNLNLDYIYLGIEDFTGNNLRIYGSGTNDIKWGDSPILHSGNYNSYAPTLTGTGASGTWGISISGNAATATNAINADKLANITASTYFKNRDCVFNSEWGATYLWTIWDNHLYAADKRFAVTSTGTDSTNFEPLFDGSFESSISISSAQAVLHIKHTDAGNVWSEGLPYGSFYVVFYNSDAENVTGRVYCNYAAQGIGWHTLGVTHIRTGVWKLDNSYYQLSDLEITITKPTSSANIHLCQILHEVSRSAGPYYAAVMSKYCNQKTNYTIEAAKFIGPLQGNASSASKLQTPRTIWGQSFDGTKDIDGDATFTFYDGQKIIIEKNAGGSNYCGISFYNSGFKVGSITASTLLLNPMSGGNVLIGTATDNGYKLQVNGSERVYGDLIVDGEVSALVA